MDNFLTTGKRILKTTALPLLLVSSAYIYIQNSDYINADFIRQQNDAVQHYYQTYPLITIALFIVFCTLYIGAAIPGGQLTPVAAGLFFGYPVGFLASLICYGIGPIITFIISRYCLGNYLQQRFADKLASFNQGFEKDGIWYLFIIRHVPLPFFIANLCMGLTTLSMKRYFWGNLISLLPNLIVFTYLGVSLATVESYSDLVSPQLISAYLVSVLVPPLAAKLIMRKIRQKSHAVKTS